MTNRTDPPRNDPPETGGAYRDRQGADMNWMPWIIGAIVLVLLIALIWWAMSGDDGVDTVTDPSVTTPNGVYDDSDTPSADPSTIDPVVE